VPGWTSAFEWKGYIPFDELPVSRNPQNGMLFSSNNKIAPDSYPYTLSSSYAAPYRATRVRELLGAGGRLGIDDLERIQADVLAVHARELLPALLSVTPANDLDRRALDVLRRWDYRMTAESAGAAVFGAWYIQMAESLFADELGAQLWQVYSDQLHMVSMAMSSSLRTGSEWCDDVRTPAVETCSATASAALSLAMTRMAAAQGNTDVAAWQWSKAHRTVFSHQPFGPDPVLGLTFNRTAPAGGDKHTLNVASNASWRDYDQKHIAIYRQVIDLGDLTRSRWISAPGQSGIPGDSRYDDLIDEWRHMGYQPMLFKAKDVRDNAVEELELRP
jgi:penicillin amidase